MKLDYFVMTNAGSWIVGQLNTTPRIATSLPSQVGNETASLASSSASWYDNLTTHGSTAPGTGLGGHGLAEVVVIAFVAVVLMLVTVCGNMLVIIAYRRNRRLRSVNNLFLVSLACSDLVIGIVSMNLYPIYMITDTWHFGKVACDIWLCIDYTLSMASVANLMLICLDRYFSVTRPFTYRMKRTRLRAKIAIVSAWTFSMLLWSPAIVIWPRVRKRTVPNDQCYIQFFENPIITLITAIIAFYLPVVVMVILYWRIFMETKRCHKYLEYLRSYKITRAGGRSPAVKRKIPGSDSLSRMRQRINSTPAAVATRYSSLAVPPSFSTGKLRTRGYSTSFTAPNDLGENNIHEPPATHRREDRDVRDDGECENNNNSIRFSNFQRLKNAIVSSLLKHDAQEPENTSQAKNCKLRHTESSCCESAVVVDPSARFADTITPCALEDEEGHALLPSATKPLNCMNVAKETLTPKINFINNIARPPVPTIVTPEDAQESLTPLFIRRTRSEGDSFRSTAPQCRQSRGLQIPIIEENPPPRSNSVKIPSSERKAARTLSAILAAFFITWLPYNFCVVYSSFCGENCVPNAVWDFAYYLCYINSLVDPFCFALCNKTFRDTFKRILLRDNRFGRSRRISSCLPRLRNRETNAELHTVQPSTSSSRSIPPSPNYKKKESSST